ncbi:putative MFS family arabinose efflux permease [Kitasatospora gansuensis]|uniref:Putative MFS family arabinose efflux permease n=1 Tax=Kitasatospora gansuensis TaxID=258050 RepID=A0A7W7SJZ0_9ACTN|nr:MFS transporter [Kitasatospora gansuensis]MBB4950711.1 putative MFS family arabinose efflux permease [Kitasatospora gansuensis]
MTTTDQTRQSGITTPAPGPRRSLLRDRGFRLLLTAATVSRLGTSVGSLALPLTAVLALHASAGQVGLLAMLGTLSFLLIGLPAGAWIDRMRKRPVMIAADLARAALFGSVPAAWLLGVLTIHQLYLVVLLAGTATVFFDVAAQSHLPDLVERDRLTEANAHLATTDAVTQVGGRSAGGFLTALLTAPAAVAVDAVSYLCSAVCLLRIRRPEPLPRPHLAGRSLAGEIRQGLRFVFGHPLLRPLVLAAAAGNLSIQVCQTMLPVVFVQELELPESALGLFFATGGIGVFLGSLSARRLAHRLGAGRVLWLMGLAVAPVGVLVAVVDRGPALWLAALAWLVTTFKVGINNVIMVSFRQSVTPDLLLGRMNATVRVVLTGSLAIGAALAGLLGEFASPRTALWVGAVGLATAWLPILLSPLRTGAER